MKPALIVILALLVSACSDTASQQRFTDCPSVAERVALDTTSPEALSALAIFSDEVEKSEAREQAESELETQRAVFMTAAHEQRMVLAFTKVNRFAERYLDAYAKCREIDAGEG